MKKDFTFKMKISVDDFLVMARHYGWFNCCCNDEFECVLNFIKDRNRSERGLTVDDLIGLSGFVVDYSDLDVFFDTDDSRKQHQDIFFMILNHPGIISYIPVEV